MNNILRFNLLSLFPGFFESPLKTSLIEKAVNNKIIEYNLINIRDFTNNKHNKVDDTPYGGGAGMIMMVEPIYQAIQSIREKENTIVVLTSPRGRQYSHQIAHELFEKMTRGNYSLSIISGHYEGIDARVEKYIADYSLSSGPYINSGGEIASLLFLDSISRFHPEFMGNQNSIKDESFSIEGYIEYPQYTRPPDFNSWKVPEVLKSGNHEEILRWKQKMSFSLEELQREDE